MNPILAEIIRGDIVESIHRGSVIVVDTEGREQFSRGEITAIYPRSSLKPLQAIPLIESGCAEAQGLSLRQIAIACASHNGEAMHSETVTAWLQQMSLRVDQLVCGPELPRHRPTKHALLRSGEDATRAQHNCSGKHTAMLSVCQHIKADVDGYAEHDHAVQRLWMQCVSDLIGEDASVMPWERDGCGLPALHMPMAGLAHAFAQFAKPQGQPAKRAAAMNTIRQALTAEPLMIAGNGRCCSAVIAETAGNVLVKTGAEGVFAGVIIDQGLGFTLKIDDGHTRGSEAALGHLLRQLNAIDDEQFARLQKYFAPTIINSQGWQTGYMRGCA